MATLGTDPTISVHDKVITALFSSSRSFVKRLREVGYTGIKLESIYWPFRRRNFTIDIDDNYFWHFDICNLHDRFIISLGQKRKYKRYKLYPLYIWKRKAEDFYKASDNDQGISKKIYQAAAETVKFLYDEYLKMEEADRLAKIVGLHPLVKEVEAAIDARK